MNVNTQEVFIVIFNTVVSLYPIACLTVLFSLQSDSVLQDNEHLRRCCVCISKISGHKEAGMDSAAGTERNKENNYAAL